jgi:hypothetical protein
MKKQIVTVIGASVLVATSAFADVSIKGDALFRHSSVTNATALNDNGDEVGGQEKNEQRVRLHVTGKAGKTSLHLTVRSDGRSRASGGAQQGGSNGGIKRKVTNASTDTISVNNNSAQLNVDQLYIKTSVGKVNIQAGDWWWTTGFGLVQKGKGTGDRVQFSTKVGGVKLVAGYNQNNDEKGNNTDEKKTGGTGYVVIAGKIKGWAVALKHTADTNPNEDSTEIFAGEKEDTHDNSFNDITVKGSVKGVNIAVELFKGNIAHTDAFLLHVSKKIKGVTLHFATAYYGAWVEEYYGKNKKFSPLGVSILGSASGVNGGLALGNVSGNFSASNDTSVVGFRADFKVKAVDVKVALGQFDANQDDDTVVKDFGTDNCKTIRFCDETSAFVDLSVAYPLSKGATLKGTYGTWAGETSMGAKISVKF